MSPRIILITGANSGVGYTTAKVLADASENHVVIMTGRTMDKVQTARSEIESSGIKGKLVAVQLDINDQDSIDEAAKHVENDYGHLDVLISNAAVGNRDPDLRTRLTLSFETNVVGNAVVAEKFRPLLLKSDNPYSIFVSSGAGSITQTSKGSHKMQYDEGYRVSKAALNMLAVIENRDYGPQGLKVFAMCPGFVISNLRGTSEEQRNPGGQAGDPIVSGQTILSIINGERDDQRGGFVHKDGTYGW